MHCRVREEQERKQLSQEQQLQEAKAQEAKRLNRQNQENKEKEQQTQLEKEVRGHYNPPVPHVLFEFIWVFDFFQIVLLLLDLNFDALPVKSNAECFPLI